MAITEKRWDKSFEKPIYDKWLNSKAYAFDEKTKKPVFSIDTPPPYVNQPVHIGQASTYVLMDMFARYRRMSGWEVIFPLGLDRNGLPIEMAAEQKFGKKLNEVPRPKFLKMCESILQESSDISKQAFLRLGVSFNSYTLGKKIGDLYHTDSPEFRALTQSTFIDLWNKDLIEQQDRINNYCPGCRTTIADAEVAYEDIHSMFNEVKFKVKETGENIVIGTTRPELICTCAMVIYNPADKRYKRLEGKTAITPIFEKEVPIKAHTLAQIDKGTGLVMMCSMGDLSDIRFFREQDLTPEIAIDIDGKMNEKAGFLSGLDAKGARKKMIEELRNKNLLVGQRQTLHRTPICERSKDEIEFISMKEFYLKQIEQKPQMERIAKEVKFFSPKSRKILLDWIDSVSIDWPISRRRYYATEIPLWYCKKCGEPTLAPKGKYVQPWKDAPPVNKCLKCGGKEFTGEERVFDTWFDSSTSPLYILGYERYPDFFKKYAPCTLRPQGKEIVRTWLYYSLLKCYLLTGKTIFRNAWINYHILDAEAKKMSKSKGNIIDPISILDSFGAEPFRFWVALEGNLTQTDFRCSFDKIEGESKFLTKLWNIARFITQFEAPKTKPEPTPTDLWIRTELSRLVKEAKKGFDNYDFHNPVVDIRNFIWEDFASNYLEMVKQRAYNQEGAFSQGQQAAAIQTLNHVLDVSLKLLAPVLPFITYRLHFDIHGKDIHQESFPEAEKITSKLASADIRELNGLIWKAKKDRGLSLRSSVKELVIPEKFRPLQQDLVKTHNVEKLVYGKEIKVLI
ncbi:MAG: valine--tRNA ligase [Candidatus Aenigmatarchaeota archaeon]